MQLAQGDYLLSNNMAVERKSVETGDLAESLRSGKLEKQLLAMSRRFKSCFLLIEWPEKSTVSLAGIECNGYLGRLNWLQPERKEPRQSNLGYLLSLLVFKLPSVYLL